MKTLGMIGGTSWHSTIQYYRHINQATNDHYGDNTNPPLILFNMNQSMIHALQRKEDWNQIAELITDAAERLQKAGAEGLIFCANTPHKVFELVTAKIKTPIFHICDATSAAIAANGLTKVGLIGTRFTMEQAFMVKRFSQNGIEAIVPVSNEQIVEAIGRYVELGLDEVIVPDFTLGGTATERSEAYDRFNEEIVPAFA